MNWYMLWFVLAGAILGFALSTVWEWLYYRSKRAVVRDARINELEAALRAYHDRGSEPVMTGSLTHGVARLETEEPESLAETHGAELASDGTLPDMDPDPNEGRVSEPVTASAPADNPPRDEDGTFRATGEDDVA